MLGFQSVGWGTALLAFAEDKVPNEAARALSPSVGWVMLIGAIALCTLFIVHNERWRRFWNVAEDPRAMALYRIVFGFFVICNVNDLLGHFTFLFTDEGIFTADVARQVHAAAQFKGFGDGFSPEEPWGFFDAWGVIEFLKGPKWSLLYFWDTPAFFWGHLAAFEVCAALFMIGFRTRLMGVLTFVLMNSIFFRNHLFWEGTELVYRVFLAYLICAKSGHAYSVDNWLRCRTLRRQGLLSERDGPGGGAGVAPSPDHPRGLQAVYRLIPSWPRKLAMAQLAAVYAVTGILKNGSVWAKGDAIYYAWNMDHFYRFYPQRISALLGTNLLRLATWVTHWGEVFFFFCFLGVLVHFARAEKFAPATGWRRTVTHLCWLTIIAVSGAVIWITWSVHFVPPWHPAVFVGPWVALWLGIYWLWGRLERKPFIIRRKRPVTIDHGWVARWILGRRIWLPWHLAVMGGIFLLMNIGQFQTGMLSNTLVYLAGFEVATGLRRIGRRLGKWGVPGIPADVREGLPPLPAEDPTLPHLHRDSVRFPQWAMFITLGIVVVGIVVAALVKPEWSWLRIWWAALLFAAGVAFQTWRSQRRRKLEPDAEGERPRIAWAYGPRGRFPLSTLLIWHITAVTVWLLPEKDSLDSFRHDGRRIFTIWLTRTQTDQGWGMFAPNPPRSNVFLKVLVTDQDGNVWDMKTDVYAPEMKPIPWIWNDRIRKMNRRIIGGESGDTSWYRKWHARYYCRFWALDPERGNGTAPKKVELVKVSYRIPSPEAVARDGWYVPEDLLERTREEKVEHTENCKTAVMGQLPNWVRERHGLDPLPDNEKYKPWIKHKKKAWERDHAPKEEPPVEDGEKDPTRKLDD